MGIGHNPLALQERIGYTFRDTELLLCALTHSSFANEHKPSVSNERLEFLGDAVLELHISRYLYRAHPQATEGELTRLRQMLVCEDALFEIATALSLAEHLSVGKGEELAGIRYRPSILADALEALIAAIDIDSNGEATEEIILDLFGKRLRLSGQATVTDYKTKLQQLVQQDGNEELSYFVVSAVGPEHDKLFEVEARINSNVVGRGNGKSKRDAEQNAAREALLLFGLKL